MYNILKPTEKPTPTTRPKVNGLLCIVYGTFRERFGDDKERCHGDTRSGASFLVGGRVGGPNVREGSWARLYVLHVPLQNETLIT